MTHDTYSKHVKTTTTAGFVLPSILNHARLWLIAGIATAASALSTAALAQQDPSGRVGRISTVDGQVWIRDASNEQVAGVINWPIAQGASLETGLSSRTEVRIGSTSIRFAPSTKAQFTELNDATIRVNVEHGSVALRFKATDKARETFVSSQSGTVNFSEAGRYRVDVDYDRTTFSVFQGQARLDTQASSFGLRSGGRMEVSSSGNTRNTELFADGFDDWVNKLDRRDDSRPAPRYVSREMTGYDTLEDNGYWNDVDGYGAVWYPRAVVSDWAPYRYGHWTNLQPWGWTWVDDAPWGFAVSHYGRWGWIGGRWGWVPGAIVSRPVWAPALVAWGGGSGWNWNVSVGSSVNYGWVPLAPAEVYVPWYRVSPRYCNNVNVAHITNVTVINNYYQNPGSQAFANAQVPGAVSAAAAGAAFAGRTFPVASSLGTTSGSMARAAAAAQQGAVVQQPSRQQIRAVTDIKFASAAFNEHRIVAPAAAAAAAAGQAAPVAIPIKVTAPIQPALAVQGNPAANAAAAAARGAQAQPQVNIAPQAPAIANMPQSGRPLNNAANPAAAAAQVQGAQQVQNPVREVRDPRDGRAAQEAARAAATQQRAGRGEPPVVQQQAVPQPAQQQAQPAQPARPDPRVGQRDPREAQNAQAAQAAAAHAAAQAAARESRAAPPPQIAAPPQQQREVRPPAPVEQRAPREARPQKEPQQNDGPPREREVRNKSEREDFLVRRLQER